MRRRDAETVRCGTASGKRLENCGKKRVSSPCYEMAKLLLGKQNVIWSLPGALRAARGIF